MASPTLLRNRTSAQASSACPSFFGAGAGHLGTRTAGSSNADFDVRDQVFGKRAYAAEWRSPIVRITYRAVSHPDTGVYEFFGHKAVLSLGFILLVMSTRSIARAGYIIR